MALWHLFKVGRVNWRKLPRIPTTAKEGGQVMATQNGDRDPASSFHKHCGSLVCAVRVWAKRFIEG